jgi:hypothetical protein
MSEPTFSVTYDPDSEQFDITLRSLTEGDVQAIRGSLAGRQLRWTLDRVNAMRLLGMLTDGLLLAIESDGAVQPGHCMKMN